MRRHQSRIRAARPRAGLPVAILGSIALSLSALPAHGTEPVRDIDHDPQERPSSLRAPGAVTVTGAATPASARAVTATPIVGMAATAATHTVGPGDTVSRIAAQHGLRTKDVLAWNGLGWSSVIFPGQTLKLTGAVAASSTAPTAAPAAAAETYTVQRGDTLWAISRSQGVSLSRLQSLNGLSDRSVIHPGQKLKLSGASTGTATPVASAPSTGTSTAAAAGHTVAAGDTLWAIAHKHGTSVSALLTLNGLKSTSIIYPGQKLAVKLAAAPAAASTPVAAAPAASGSGAAAHTVAAGDTLWAIATKHGTSVSALLTVNGLTDASIIYPGQRLKLPSTTGLDAEQTGNAQLIIRVGRDRGVPDRGIAIALATAMVESGIRNLHYGDRDSQGLFQQRPSTGWGTVAQVTDPYRSAAAFYGGASDPNGSDTRGLLDIAGWQAMPFTEAAQAVQISAFPDRYGQWEKQAFGWLAALG